MITIKQISIDFYHPHPDFGDYCVVNHITGQYSPGPYGSKKSLELTFDDVKKFDDTFFTPKSRAVVLLSDYSDHFFEKTSKDSWQLINFDMYQEFSNSIFEPTHVVLIPYKKTFLDTLKQLLDEVNNEVNLNMKYSLS